MEGAWMALKALGVLLPGLLYLAAASAIWRGRALGPRGRQLFATIGTVAVAGGSGMAVGFILGALAYDLGPGASCRELGCLAGIAWAGAGIAAGLPTGLVAGWRLRALAQRSRVGFLAAPAAVVLWSLALVIFNSDMLR